MSQQYDFDYFVIGAGSGGVRSARIAAGLGARTGIAEARYFGGTCVNVGCIPKKLYSYAAETREVIADSRAYGWHLDADSGFDWPTLKRNKDKEIARLNGIYENLLRNAGAEIFEAHARLEGPGKVRVGDKLITARHILLATGGKPFVPDIPGAHHGLTSDDVFAMETQPRSVLIVGGGYIALELAGIFSGTGSTVTLVHRGEQVLRGFDDDISRFMTDAAQAQFDLRLNTEVVAIEKTDADNAYIATLSDGARHSCDAIIFATGRVPLTHSLGLETCSIKTSQSGAIVVDDNFTTSHPGIYAVGDVIDRMALTPVALAEGQLLAQRLFGTSNRLLDYNLIPSAVFSNPQVASVGQTEKQAREGGTQVVVYKSRFRPLKHTMTGRDQQTLIKMIVDSQTDRVLGLHMAGADAAEIMQGMAVALQAGATKAHFDATLGIHPTAAEEFVTMRTPEPAMKD